MSFTNRRSISNLDVHQLISKKMIDEESSQIEKNFVKNSIKLNMNKLPRDWFTPKPISKDLPSPDQ